jgi:hypothetical protein
VLLRRQDRSAREALRLLGWREATPAGRRRRWLRERLGVDPPWVELALLGHREDR